MEQRKLVQHGLSSLSVVLPFKWLKDRGLNKGDSIHLDIQGNKLVISTDEPVKIEKISIDVTQLDRTSIIYNIQSLYRFGYNEIEVRFDKPYTLHYRKDKKVYTSSVIHFTVNRLIGAEVVEQLNDKIIIKFITKEAEDDFKVILRRVFLLLKETAVSLLEGIKENDNDIIASIDEKHDNITKFVSYSLRLLNKYGYPDVKKTSIYYHIIASLDNIADILKYNAREMLRYQKKCNKETLAILEKINKSIINYYELFYKFDTALINDLSKNRDNIKSVIREKIGKLPEEEINIITSMKEILELVLDLTDARMGLEY